MLRVNRRAAVKGVNRPCGKILVSYYCILFSWIMSLPQICNLFTAAASYCIIILDGCTIPRNSSHATVHRYQWLSDDPACRSSDVVFPGDIIVSTWHFLSEELCTISDITINQVQTKTQDKLFPHQLNFSVFFPEYFNHFCTVTMLHFGPFICNRNSLNPMILIMINTVITTTNSYTNLNTTTAIYCYSNA